MNKQLQMALETAQRECVDYLNMANRMEAMGEETHKATYIARWYASLSVINAIRQALGMPTFSAHEVLAKS